jgi:hypothetical protein
VELAAIQGLGQQLKQKELELQELKEKNRSLEQRLEAIEETMQHQPKAKAP